MTDETVVMMCNTRQLLKCIILLSAFLVFNLCLIKALIIHHTGSCFCNYSSNSLIREVKHTQHYKKNKKNIHSLTSTKRFYSVNREDKLQLGYSFGSVIGPAKKKNAFRPQCGAFSLRLMVHMLQAQMYWREMEGNLYPKCQYQTAV